MSNPIDLNAAPDCVLTGEGRLVDTRMTRHAINRRMTGSAARTSAYDRRLAAIHEAGHAIMALFLGYDADVWIHRNETSAPRDEKLWIGHMTIRHDLSEVRRSDVRMIAVAGMVAETLWKNGHDEEYAEPYGWDDILWDDACMSPSDWRLAGYEPGEPDDDLFSVVAGVAGLFMSDLWPVLTDLSRTLMGDTETIHSFVSRTPRGLAA